MTAIERLAIVNRGEAAMRALRAVAEYERNGTRRPRTIALYTEPDATAWFVREADEAINLGPATYQDGPEGRTRHTYVDLRKLEKALVEARADAVWVGWGFVSEDADFAALCERRGITFIGPPSAVIEKLGDKIGAKRLAEEADVPVSPWSNGPVTDLATGREAAERIGYPLLVKAAAGGGGRGIRKVERPEDLEQAIIAATYEGESSFGDGTVFLEKVVAAARHLEVQMIADTHGNAWAVGVRDCSLQRRNQKVIEETGSAIPPHIRTALKDAATRLLLAAGYHNAGTVEFLYDPRVDEFYFMEVNTRLQVEHTVTEMTTGLDLVKLQLDVAQGGKLDGDPPPEVGHAIEVRLNAEDPERGFAPAPGRVEHFRTPAGPGVRVDTGIAEGDEIAAAFDSMVAKILTWGSDRDEALARMRRALKETIVVIAGGTTNKAFLLSLLDRPEVKAAEVDTNWLDRLTAMGQHLPSHHGACLLAAAVEAYQVDHGIDRASFISSAARGRPEARTDTGRKVELRFRGNSYALQVHQLGPVSYRLETGEGVVDLEMEHLGPYERRLSVGGERLRVVVDVQGPTYLIEVEGIPHRVERDDGGLIRAPAPAVIISIAVQTGDEVAAGDALAVIESMKMETTVYAPFAGRVRNVMAAPKTQVDGGAPLVQLEPTGEHEDPSTAGAKVDLTLGIDDGSRPSDPRDRYADLLGALRTYLLGYDLDPSTLESVRNDLGELHGQVHDVDEELLELEHEILDAYADIGVLSRRAGDGDPEAEELGISAREHLLAYLRMLDRPEDAVPERFLDRVRRALSRYGVESLDHNQALEEALSWLYRAHLRIHELTPAVAAVLDRWMSIDEAIVGARGSVLRDLLDRVIDAAEGRERIVSDVAREVRFHLVDEPVLEAARSEVYREMRRILGQLAEDPRGNDRQDLLDQIVACPQPLRAMLLDQYFQSGPEMQELVLEARVRRYYRIRPVRELRFEHHDGTTWAVADYSYEGRDICAIVAYGRGGELGELLDALRARVEGTPLEREVVIDLALLAPGEWMSISDLADDVHATLVDAAFSRPVNRVDVTVTFGGDEPQHERTRHVTLRQRDGQYVEDRIYRNLHPMLAKRIGLWQLREFDIHRIASVEDVYLFHGTARSNPDDERLFGIAEVRDLTPIRDDEGRVTALPDLERMIVQALAGMRRFQARLPAEERLLHNFLILHVRPLVTIPKTAWRDLAHRVAPATVGLGLEKVMLHVRIPDRESGGVQDAVLHVENVASLGVVVRREAPTGEPIPTLSAYEQKVLRTQRRGSMYPYELVHLLTPPEDAGSDFPPGEFIEYDLDDDGRLVPVARQPGGNTANLVVGIITNRTAKIPEGMERVILLGDPSSSLGSLAEPECRRIIAAIDIAERRGIPVEWFAVSSGARIAMDTGTENMDWIGETLKRIISFTQAGGEINIIVTGINVGAQPYFNAEATMLMHTKGILVMTPDSAMVLTGKQALDFSGGVSAEDNFGIGGYERIMGPNGQGQYWAPTLEAGCAVLFRHYDHAYVVPGESHPRRAETSDPADRDVRDAPLVGTAGTDFDRVGDVFSMERNPERKKPFDIRSVMRAVTDADHEPLERWKRWRDAETAVVWDAHVGGHSVTLIGIESTTVPRQGVAPLDGPSAFTAGTLFPQSSRKLARALNAASGNRPAVVLANLSGFDGSPESLRQWQLEYGAEIGRAVTNFDGPIVFVVISRYHGGAFVVFSKRLNRQMEVAAVEGSHASVIGGTPAAAVVFSRDVRKRTEADPRVLHLREQIDRAGDGDVSVLRAELEDLREQVHAEKIGEMAQEFDRIHDIARAKEVGSVDHIIPAAELRPYVIDAVERGLARRVD